MKIVLSIILIAVAMVGSVTRAEGSRVFTLNDCVELTLENNPQLKGSEMDIMTSRGNYG